MTSATETPNFCRCCLVNQSNLFDMKNQTFEIGRTKINFCKVFFELAGINQQFAIPGIDDHPKICRPCSVQLKCAFVFRTLCRKVDIILRSKYSPEVPTATLMLVADAHDLEGNVCYDEMYVNNAEGADDEKPGEGLTRQTTNRIIIDVKNLPLPSKINKNHQQATSTMPSSSDAKVFKHPDVLNSSMEGPKLYKCLACPINFLQYTDWNKHRRSCPQLARIQVRECKYCQKKFKNKSNLWEHTFDHLGIVPYNCRDCRYKTKRRATFSHHLLDEHNIVYDETIHGYNGRNINYKGIRFSKLSRDSIAETQPVESSVRSTPTENGDLSKNLFRKSSYITAAATNENLIANFLTTTEEEYGHAEKPLLEIISTSTVLVAARDDFQAPPPAQRNNHVRSQIRANHFSHSMQHLQGSGHNAIRKKALYNCKFCIKSFKHSNGLREHLFDHTKLYPFNCPVEDCGYFSKRKSIFKSHLRRHDIDLLKLPDKNKVSLAVEQDKEREDDDDESQVVDVD
jgi:hypothetical protein